MGGKAELLLFGRRWDVEMQAEMAKLFVVCITYM